MMQADNNNNDNDNDPRIGKLLALDENALNEKDKKGNTPLMALLSNTSLCRLIMKNGYTNKDGEKLEGDVAFKTLITKLIDGQKDINTYNEYGETAICLAIKLGNFGCNSEQSFAAVKALLERDDLDLAQGYYYRQSALHVAVRCQNARAVELLLEDASKSERKNALNIEEKDYRGNTAFYYAHSIACQSLEGVHNIAAAESSWDTPPEKIRSFELLFIFASNYFPDNDEEMTNLQKDHLNQLKQLHDKCMEDLNGPKNNYPRPFLREDNLTYICDKLKSIINRDDFKPESIANQLFCIMGQAECCVETYHENEGNNPKLAFVNDIVTKFREDKNNMQDDKVIDVAKLFLKSILKKTKLSAKWAPGLSITKSGEYILRSLNALDKGELRKALFGSSSAIGYNKMIKITGEEPSYFKAAGFFNTDAVKKATEAYHSNLTDEYQQIEPGQ